MNRAALLCAFLGLLPTAACGDDDNPTDASVVDGATDDGGGDAGNDAGVVCEAPTPIEGGAAAQAVTLGSGLVAGMLSEAQLPDDTFGLAEWRPGDLVLANERVALVISSETHPGQPYDPHGGRPVTVARVDGDQLVGAPKFGLVLLSVGRFLVDTESVTVMADGSDGEATIRVAGPLASVDALGDAVSILSPNDYTGGYGAVDFTLRADSDVVDVTMHARVPRATNESVGSLQVFFQANRMSPWRLGSGFGEVDGMSDYVAFDSTHNTAYAWMAPPERQLNRLLAFGGADVFSTGLLRLECGENELPLGRMVIGDGAGLPAVQRSVGTVVGGDFTERSGRVEETGGTAISDVRVHVVAADGTHLTRFVPADDGTFTQPISNDAASYFVWRQGQPLAGPFDVVDDAVLTLPATATLEVRVTHTDDGSGMPSKVEVFPMSGDAPSVEAAFGERTPGAGRLLLANTANGEVDFQLPPGMYRLRVGRGPTYTRYEEVVEVPGRVDVDIAPVMVNPGVLCGDFHIHTFRSVDSPDHADDKIRALVAEGVQIAIRTEHEYVSDFGPVVEGLGLGDHAVGFGGLELTTVSYGHFNTFPLSPDASLPGGGAPLWPGKLPSELFDEVRDRAESPTLIINHPRSGGSLQGYFAAAGFDPVTGMVDNPDMWDEDFNVVEVFNESNFESNREETVADWFALLNQGRAIAAVGSSDSHRLAGVPLGYPRTCLDLGTDNPREVTGSMVQEAVEMGRSVIVGGLDLRIAGPGGEGPGARMTGVGASVDFDVRVIAAEFVDADELEVIVDGETVDTIAITDIGEGVRLDTTVTVPVAAGGSWVVFHASGGTAYDANGSLPFAVSNPIFMMP